VGTVKEVDVEIALVVLSVTVVVLAVSLVVMAFKLVAIGQEPSQIAEATAKSKRSQPEREKLLNGTNPHNQERKHHVTTNHRRTSDGSRGTDDCH